MALPKKGSRKIKVATIDYLWMVKDNGKQINLIISPIENGAKILTSFNYNLGPALFIVKPYIVKEVILYAIKKGYSPTKKSKELNLGYILEKPDFKLLADRSFKKLINKIEKRIHINNFTIKEKQYIQSSLNDAKELILDGENLIALENLVSNLGEINFKAEPSELLLIKELFYDEHVDWKKDWGWIEEMKK